MSLIYDGFLLMVGAVLAYVTLHVVGWIIFIAICADEKGGPVGEKAENERHEAQMG